MSGAYLSHRLQSMAKHKQHRKSDEGKQKPRWNGGMAVNTVLKAKDSLSKEEEAQLERKPPLPKEALAAKKTEQQVSEAVRLKLCNEIYTMMKSKVNVMGHMDARSRTRKASLT